LKGKEVVFDAVIDTAFTGAIALSDQAVAALQSIASSSGRFFLADGLRKRFDIQLISVHWTKGWRVIEAPVLGDETLIGMRLLEDHELRIQVKDGGAVEITPLP
jgi:predicted aspartyl protease